MDVFKRMDDREGEMVFELRLLPEQAEQIGNNTSMELAFALGALDANDPATLRWLAACALQRALDIGGG